MGTLNATTISNVASRAGFKGEANRIITAIALAESGGDEEKLGDLNRVGERTQDGRTWGPSAGLTQIRSIKEEFGTGRQRDQLANLVAATNMRHAFEISGGGADFRAWTTYKDGTYKKFLESATAGEAHDGVSIGELPGHVVDSAANLVTDALGALVEPFVNGLRRLSIIGLAVALGVGLVGVGAWRSVGANRG